MSRLPLACALLLCSSAAAVAADPPALRWIPLPDARFEVDGLPWYRQNNFELIRFPVSHKDDYRPDVWGLAQNLSGGRIRFATDATAIAIRLEYPGPASMRNMHAFGQAGVDLYADGVYIKTATPEKDSGPGKTVEFVYFDYAGEPRKQREIVLYLPLYEGVKVLSIGVDPDARFETARPFALPKPVVFYGTSITQGGCASRPGMSYQAILARVLNIDFVNLGFSGNGLGEPAVARDVASIEASAYVLDFAQNNPTADSLRDAYAPFIERIRKQHPTTPIVCITPIYSTLDAAPGGNSRLEGMRAVIRKAAGDRIAAGDLNLQIVEGTDLLGPAQGDGLVDGTHPNDLGFQWMAEGLEKRLRKVLKLQ